MTQFKYLKKGSKVFSYSIPLTQVLDYSDEFDLNFVEEWEVLKDVEPYYIEVALERIDKYGNKKLAILDLEMNCIHLAKGKIIKVFSTIQDIEMFFLKLQSFKDIQRLAKNLSEHSDYLLNKGKTPFTGFELEDLISVKNTLESFSSQF